MDILDIKYDMSFRKKSLFSKNFKIKTLHSSYKVLDWKKLSKTKVIWYIPSYSLQTDAPIILVYRKPIRIVPEPRYNKIAVCTAIYLSQ